MIISNLWSKVNFYWNVNHLVTHYIPMLCFLLELDFIVWNCGRSRKIRAYWRGATKTWACIKHHVNLSKCYFMHCIPSKHQYSKCDMTSTVYYLYKNHWFVGIIAYDEFSWTPHLENLKTWLYFLACYINILTEYNSPRIQRFVWLPGLIFDK